MTRLPQRGGLACADVGQPGSWYPAASLPLPQYTIFFVRFVPLTESCVAKAGKCPNCYARIVAGRRDQPLRLSKTAETTEDPSSGVPGNDGLAADRARASLDR